MEIRTAGTEDITALTAVEAVLPTGRSCHCAGVRRAGPVLREPFLALVRGGQADLLRGRFRDGRSRPDR